MIGSYFPRRVAQTPQEFSRETGAPRIGRTYHERTEFQWCNGLMAHVLGLMALRVFSKRATRELASAATSRTQGHLAFNLRPIPIHWLSVRHGYLGQSQINSGSLNLNLGRSRLSTLSGQWGYDHKGIPTPSALREIRVGL